MSNRRDLGRANCVLISLFGKRHIQQIKSVLLLFYSLFCETLHAMGGTIGIFL